MRWILPLLLAACVVTCASAQDIPNITLPPTDSPKVIGTDWPTIIDKIGDWLFKILVLVGGWYKLNSVQAQGVKNEQNITQGRVEAKTDIAVQNSEIKNVTANQTNQLLMAKIIEKPVAVVPVVPPLPPLVG